MKKIAIFCLTLSLAIMSGCSQFQGNVQDIEVSAATDPKVNLAAYKTYTWLATGKILHDPENKWQAPNMDLTGDIKYLIDRELRKKGVNSHTTEADLAVAFFLGVDMQAMALKDDPNTAENLLENVPQGALVVALIDVNTGYVAWLGLAKANIIAGATPEQIRTRLNYAVRKMFKSFK